jgi:hypothetical protein
MHVRSGDRPVEEHLADLLAALPPAPPHAVAAAERLPAACRASGGDTAPSPVSRA